MAEANSILIRQNPVVAWERFNRPLYYGRGDYSDYQDDDRAMGGFWSCSFKYYATANELYDMFDRGLAREVVAYGYGTRVLHEGLIYEMVLNVPPDRLTTSLESVFNKMHMRSDYDADNATERSTTLQNTDSQGRFGVKQRVMGGGQLDSLAVADQAVQTVLDTRGWPSASLDRGSARGETYIEMFVRGYIETLNWTLYNQTASSGTQGLSAQFVDALTGGEYIASIEYETNSTLVTKVYDADLKRLSIGMNLAKLGDSNNDRWIMYMTEGRVLHLKEAAPPEVAA